MMDRFSQPLWNEGKMPSNHAEILEEMQEEVKLDLVREYVWSKWDEENTLPDFRDVLEHFYQVDLDSDMIKYVIQQTKENFI